MHLWRARRYLSAALPGGMDGKRQRFRLPKRWKVAACCASGNGGILFPGNGRPGSRRRTVIHALCLHRGGRAAAWTHLMQHVSSPKRSRPASSPPKRAILPLRLTPCSFTRRIPTGTAPGSAEWRRGPRRGPPRRARVEPTVSRRISTWGKRAPHPAATRPCCERPVEPHHAPWALTYGRCLWR